MIDGVCSEMRQWDRADGAVQKPGWAVFLVGMGRVMAGWGRNFDRMWGEVWDNPLPTETLNKKQNSDF